MNEEAADDRTLGIPLPLGKKPELLNEFLKNQPAPEERPAPPRRPKSPPPTPPAPAPVLEPDPGEDLRTLAPPRLGQGKRPKVDPLGLNQPPPAPPAPKAPEPPPAKPPAAARPVPKPENSTGTGSTWPGAAAQLPPGGGRIVPKWDDPTETPNTFKTALGPLNVDLSVPTGIAPVETSSTGSDVEQPQWTIPGGKNPLRAPEARRVPAPAPPPAAPQPRSVPRPEPVPPPAPAYRERPSYADADPNHTVAIGRGVVRAAPGRLLVIQYFDGVERWHDLEPIKADGHVLGRANFARSITSPDFMASEHVLLVIDGKDLYIESLDTINGAFLKVAPGRPVELVSGSRFQVGHHVIEFRLPEPRGPIAPLTSPEGEVFRTRSLVPLAFLDFIEPNNQPGLSFPLTKPDRTVIGREGENCDIALPGDEWASRLHSQVVRRENRFYLEDLNSRNGTFLQIIRKTPLRYGSQAAPESGVEILIGAVLVRVVEK